MGKDKIICITPIKHINGAYKLLEKCGKVLYFPYINKDELRDKIILIGSNIIFTNPNKQQFKVDRGILAGTKIRIICTASTGTDHIDMDYCRENDIEVISLTTEYEVIRKISSTAEMAFTLMLALIRNLPKAIDSVKKYEWDYEEHIGRQLNYMVVGIIGYGRLGEHFARFCSPFFKEVLITDPYKTVNNYKQVELDELLFKSDVVVLHVHLNNNTFHLINKEVILKMKDGAYLINTSRGNIVNEKEVIKAIKKGKIKGYAADVISNELGGGIKESPIIKAMNQGYNIIISPHIAGMTTEAQEIAYCGVIDKLINRLKEI